MDNGLLVAQPKLISRLFQRGKSAKIYPPADLRALLYGNRQKQRSDDPDFTAFPLEFTSQAATYQRILTRTLRLDRLDSRELKNYLLEIFKNDLQYRSVDFKCEWDKSFYLDEAASLDQRNQRNLIETAAEFGFSLIFASPEPQITARYCVPIGSTNGKNYISRLSWQILEPIGDAG